MSGHKKGGGVRGMGWICKYQKVCYKTLNWDPLNHASHGPQLRVLQHVCVCMCVSLCLCVCVCVCVVLDFKLPQSTSTTITTDEIPISRR